MVGGEFLSLIYSASSLKALMERSKRGFDSLFLVFVIDFDFFLPSSSFPFQKDYFAMDQFLLFYQFPALMQ